MVDLRKGVAQLIAFVLVDIAGNEVPGLGAGFTVEVSEAGTPFAAGAGAKAEIGSGWYSYVLTATETDTLGALAVKITAVGAVQQNLLYQVVSPVWSPALAPAVAISTSSARYAEAWEYAAFWCAGNLLQGMDDSGLAGQASLYDSQRNFVRLGVQFNQGMILYNLTDGSNGPVTAVTSHGLTATLSGGVVNLWNDGDAYRITLIDGTEIDAIEHYLAVAASDIHAALGSAGAYGCTLAAWAAGYLKKLNIIEAAIYHQCKCGAPTISEEQRGRFFEWAGDQLNKLRTGELEVCDGETGSDYPAIGWAEQSVTEFNAARIIANRMQRGS